MSAILDLINQYQADVDAANMANDARYQDILSLYKNLQTSATGIHDQIDTTTANVGDVARQRIDANANQQFSNAQQRLISGGLANSTLLNSARRGVDRDRELSQQEVDEQQALLRQQNLLNRLGSESQNAQLLGGVMERRNDLGPDLGQFMALLQSAGAAGVGQGKTKVTIGPGSRTGTDALGRPSIFSRARASSSGASVPSQRTGVSTYTRAGRVG